MTRAAIIGAGIGGLALGLRLQAAGIATTVIEARACAGGRLGAKSALAPLDDLAAWRELWAVAGADLAAGVTILPLARLRQLNWPDGSQFDITADPAFAAAAISRLAPGDLAGYETFLAQARAQFRDRAARDRQLPGNRALTNRDPSCAGQLFHAFPDWLRGHGWRSLDHHASTLVRSEKLRQALAFRPLLTGRNPLTTPATEAAVLADELDRGLWWPEGGMAPLIDALRALFTGLGGDLRLNDPVATIDTVGNRATGFTTASGCQGRVDFVASTADPMHTAHTLLAGTGAGAAMADRLRRRRWSPGLFSVHFTLVGTWPGIAHDTVLFAGRWQDLLGDVFDRGVLPTDMIIRLLNPGATDPLLAPAGHSRFTAQIPVAHLGLLPIDWEAAGPLLQGRVLDQIGWRLIPDIHDRLLACHHRTPRDDALDYNAWLGSAAGPQPGRLGELWPDRGGPIANLWQLGAGAGTGASTASILAEALATGLRIIMEHAS